MKCGIECKFWNRETETCGARPTEMNDIICLLRHLCFGVNYLVVDREEELEDKEEGEWWKENT